MSIPVFSHSRIGAYEQCPKRYEFTYIGERPEEKLAGSIESFMGKRVHEALELLYQESHDGKQLSEQELLAEYYFTWKGKFTKDVIIVKGSEQEYINTGFGCLSKYYRRYAPFTQYRLIDTEKRVSIDLEGDYKMIGYVDRIDEVSPGVMEIHDYKTSSKLPSQADCDQDRQLALYSIGVKQQHPEATEIRLVWHYLKFDTERRSTRTEQQLTELKQSMISKIANIVQATDQKLFPARVTRLCNWCDFKNQCDAYQNTK